MIAIADGASRKWPDAPASDAMAEDKVRNERKEARTWSEAVWVPYKTLIGYRLGNRVFIRSYGEQLYRDEEFASMDEAINQAKTNAWETVRLKFHGVAEEDIDWDVRQDARPYLRKPEAGTGTPAPAPVCLKRRNYGIGPWTNRATALGKRRTLATTSMVL